MKKFKIAYYVFTGLLTVMLLLSVIGFYFINNDQAQVAFIALGYPTYIIIPLGIAKLFGLAAIWTGLSATLKEWAYAGFFFNFILATYAHIAVSDGEFGGGLIALVLLIGSYISNSKVTAA